MSKNGNAWKRARSHPETVTPGRLIRAARLAAGLSQRQLADAVGGIRTMVGNWERDIVLPNASNRAALAVVLGVPAVELFAGQVRDQAPEQNPAVVAARFARALMAEASAVTLADVASRQPPPPAVSNVPTPIRSRVLRLVADPTWRGSANCLGVDPDLFYPERGGSKVVQAEQIRQAKAVCASCVVRAQCLAAAIEGQEDYGIWGGLSEKERRKYQTRLPRVSRCSRCGGRYRKVASGQKFCGAACPALARPRSRSRAS